MKTIFWIFFFIYSQICFAEKGKESNFGFQGSFTMGTNQIEHGISQTRNDSTVQGEYHFLLGPQLEMGVWGSNASFVNEDNHLNLRSYLKLKIDVNPDIYFRFNYIFSHYSQASTRDGNIINLMAHIFGLILKVQQDSNFYNTHSYSTHLTLGYRWQITQFTSWENDMEENNLVSPLYLSYFDYQSKFEYEFTNMSFIVGFSTTSNKQQFQNQSGSIVFAQIQSRF